MSNNSNWRNALNAIIKQHNAAHSSRNKPVSHRTSEAREQGLFRWFSLLRDLDYTPKPKNMNGDHIKVLMRYWTASPAIAPRCKKFGVQMLDRPYSPAYIQQQLSILRVFCEWIGKPGMVRPPEHYVTDKKLVRRTYIAQEDKGWVSRGKDIGALIERVAAIDGRVAAQLNLMWQFGLRRKEAVMFCPHDAVVDCSQVPAAHHASELYAVFLRLKAGTKGGRLRYAAIRTEQQQRAIEQALFYTPHPKSHMGHPDLTLKQSLKRFDNVIRKAGITKQQLGITPHGLRHQFAGDLYFDVSNAVAPVRGGDARVDANMLKAAYLEVAHQLGHARPRISAAYLGSMRDVQ